MERVFVFLLPSQALRAVRGRSCSAEVRYGIPADQAKWKNAWNSSMALGPVLTLETLRAPRVEFAISPDGIYSLVYALNPGKFHGSVCVIKPCCS